MDSDIHLCYIETVLSCGAEDCEINKLVKIKGDDMRLQGATEMLFSHQSTRELDVMMRLVEMNAIHSIELVSLGVIVDEVTTDFASTIKEWNLTRPHFGNSSTDGILVMLSENMAQTNKIKLIDQVVEYLRSDGQTPIVKF